jgi:F-type H+-transporting ATPase subunit b
MLTLEASQIIIQIIAFLVMLWVMKRYGWKPLLGILEERRLKIQAEFDSIASQKEEVKQLALQYEERLKGIDAEMRKKIQEAIAQGQKISAEIQEDAQARAKEILQKTKSEVEGEIAKAKIELKNDMVNLVVNVTKKILQEELDASTQKKLIINFLDEVQMK